jgi:hypothetical protein
MSDWSKRMRDRAEKYAADAKGMDDAQNNEGTSGWGCLPSLGCLSWLIAICGFVWGAYFVRSIGPMSADLVVMTSWALLVLGLLWIVGGWLIQTFFQKAAELTSPNRPGQTPGEALLERADRAIEFQERAKERLRRAERLNDDPSVSRISDLKNRRDEGEIALELHKQRVEKARLKREHRDIEDSGGSEPELSAEERRTRERSDIELDLERLKGEKQKALRIEDETERILKVNAVDDAIARNMERWSRLL